MIRTTSIEEAITKELAREPIKAISFVGSQPKELKPGSDLDIVVILDSHRYEEGLEHIDEFARTLCENELLTYSLSNGPLKFKNKALLHFLIFTDDEVQLTENPAYRQEKPSVRYHQQKSARQLYGPELESFALATEDDVSHDWMEESYKRFSKYGLVLKTWVKNGSWDYKRVNIELDSWQEREIEEWFKKWL